VQRKEERRIQAQPRVRAQRPCTSRASPRTPSPSDPANGHTRGTVCANRKRNADDGAASKGRGGAHASGLVRLASAAAGTYRRSGRGGCGCCCSRSFATCDWCRAAGSSVAGSAGRRVCLQLVASRILLGSECAFVPAAVARGRTCRSEPPPPLETAVVSPTRVRASAPLRSAIQPIPTYREIGARVGQTR
jgi:hypothetical protein